MAVYICAANIRNSFVTEKSFLIKFLFLMLFSLFPPKTCGFQICIFVSDIMKSSLRKIHNSVNAYGTDYFGSEMVNSDHLSFSLFTLILPLWALITCST